MKYDVIIIGAGPAGIFTALEVIRHKPDQKILMVEKGKPVDKRHCPKAETGKCMNCKPNCMITTGFSGAGAFSDGKLSLSYEVGGDLPTLIGEDFAQELINYTDKIYLEFGADEHVEGNYEGEEIKEIRKRAIRAGLQLVNCPIRHLIILFWKMMSARESALRINPVSGKSLAMRSSLQQDAAALTGWRKSARRTVLRTSLVQ